MKQTHALLKVPVDHEMCVCESLRETLRKGLSLLLQPASTNLDYWENSHVQHLRHEIGMTL